MRVESTVESHSPNVLVTGMRFLDMEIGSLGPKGDGVFMGSRGPIFVEGGLPGDRLKAQLAKPPVQFGRQRAQAREAVTRAHIVEIVAGSEFRQAAPCAYFEKCGGCTLQHTKPDFYKSWKTEMVKAAFDQNHVRPQVWLDTVFLEGQNRRRITLTATRDRNGVTLGYYKRRSQEVTAIESCLVADPRVWEVRNRLKPILPSLLLEGQTLDFFIQATGKDTDVLITGFVGPDDVDRQGYEGQPDESFRKKLQPITELPAVRRISWRLDEQSPMLLLFTRGPVTAHFEKLDVYLPPAAFLQPTEAGQAALVRSVMSSLPGAGMNELGLRSADLFAGCGTFSGSLLSRGPVDAYESNPPSVKALTKSGAPHGLRAFKRDLSRQPLRRDELNRYDVVVMDPPRAGCLEQAYELAKSKVGTVIGVSCNPATFSRDARVLIQGGYRLESLRIIDQFQWSHHVEVVGVFRKG